ncbi:MAG: YqgE/AlgH family protein [Prosthecobacter sp.]|jgi:putative transcriptional regulator|nr:YqgE/AlgH family protein [Prosthecobacter sp.]
MTFTDDHSPLTGSLLLAVPSMRDPNFARTVVLMAAHSADDGAFGYVLNRPLGQRVADLLPDQDLGALGQAPVFLGGPVAMDKLAFASLHWNRKRGTLRCRTHLSVHDAMHEMSMGREVRGFVGYSGWGKGQLEEEIKTRSWIISPPSRLVLNAKTDESLWSKVLEEMGPVYRLMAKTPDKVELN